MGYPRISQSEGWRTLLDISDDSCMSSSPFRLSVDCGHRGLNRVTVTIGQGDYAGYRVQLTTALRSLSLWNG